MDFINLIELLRTISIYSRGIWSGLWNESAHLDRELIKNIESIWMWILKNQVKIETIVNIFMVNILT